VDRQKKDQADCGDGGRSDPTAGQDVLHGQPGEESKKRKYPFQIMDEFEMPDVGRQEIRVAGIKESVGQDADGDYGKARPFQETADDPDQRQEYPGIGLEDTCAQAVDGGRVDEENIELDRQGGENEPDILGQREVRGSGPAIDRVINQNDAGKSGQAARDQVGKGGR
jgi:hypothetical protein